MNPGWPLRTSLAGRSGLGLRLAVGCWVVGLAGCYPDDPPNSIDWDLELESIQIDEQPVLESSGAWAADWSQASRLTAVYNARYVGIDTGWGEQMYFYGPLGPYQVEILFGAPP